MGKGSLATKRINKAIGTIGASQVINLACGVLRTKIIATLIGPAGIGLFSLFNTTVNIITGIFQTGINQGLIRHIATIKEKRDVNSTALSITTILGVCLSILTLVCSSWLSEIIFGDTTMSGWVRFISVAIFFTTLSSGIFAILQANGQITNYAKAQTWAALSGLIISIPFFYFMGLDGIVPAIVIYAAVTALWTLYYLFVNIKSHLTLKLKKLFSESKELLRIGLWLSLSTVVTMLSNYIFLLWLNRETDVSIVGQWQAGYTVTERYVGILFTAMAVEYYPRISTMTRHKYAMNIACSHEMAYINRILLVLAPLLTLFAPIIVSLFYSEGFNGATEYISASAASLPLRASSFCMAYIILAMGDAKKYMLCEIASALLYLVISYYGFIYGSLRGLGYGYTIWYLLYYLITTVVCQRSYNIRLGSVANVVVFLNVAICVLLSFYKFTPDDMF